MLADLYLLGILAVAIGIGIWMAGFGHRMYRIFAILFGFGARCIRRPFHCRTAWFCRFHARIYHRGGGGNRSCCTRFSIPAGRHGRRRFDSGHFLWRRHRLLRPTFLPEARFRPSHTRASASF